MAINFDHQNNRIITSNGILDLGINGAVKLPAGTTAQRPSSPVDGMFRYNTDLATFEIYVSSAWSPISDQVAADITYDNATSGLISTTVQGAIDELDAVIDTLGTASLADTTTLLARANHTGTQLLSTISDAGTVASLDTGTLAGQVPTNADLGTASLADTTTLLARANHTGTQLLSTISDAGTAAAANVTTGGAYPTSFGDVTKVGDYGFPHASGSFLGSVDTLVSSGIYNVNSNNTEIPESSDGVIVVYTILPFAGNPVIFQEFIATSDTISRYTRVKRGNAIPWSAWTKITTAPDLGTVAVLNTGTAVGEVPTNADLGTASLADVQTSPTDSTLGALLANGSWGWGSRGNDTKLQGVDLDSVFISGVYTGYDGNNANASLGDNPFPTAAGGFSLTVTTGVDNILGAYITQTAAKFSNGGAVEIKHRSRGSTTWTGWEEIWHSGNHYSNAEIDGLIANGGGWSTAYLTEQTLFDGFAAPTTGYSFNYLTSSATNKPTGTDHAIMKMSYSAIWNVSLAADWRTNRWYVSTEENGVNKAWDRLLSETQADISGNGSITFGPNSSWSSYLRLGGNGRTVSGSTYASVVTTNGNLHLDSGDNRETYLNYYAGNGVKFGNGASGVVAVMGPDGDLWKGSADNTGDQYLNTGNLGGKNLTVWQGSSAGNYSTAGIEIREYGLVNTSQSADIYSPSLAFHWGGRVQRQIGIAANAELYTTTNNWANKQKILYSAELSALPVITSQGHPLDTGGLPVGTIAMCRYFSSASKTLPQTTAGSTLYLANCSGGISGSVLTGTWRSHGYAADSASGAVETTIWVKIA